MSGSLITRRGLMKSGALAGGGLLLGGIALRSVGAANAPADARLNAWVRVSPDDTVTLFVSQSEMGQGIMTTLPAILAQELGADWNRVKLEFAPFAPDYRHPTYQWMFTGNSESVSAFGGLMRKMGAAAREMLIDAAARRWRVPPTELDAHDSVVSHARSGRRVSFGELATAAARVKPPAEPRLRQESPLIGKPVDRVDIPSKTDGSAVFGIDVAVPGMLNATVVVCPIFGGSLKSYDAEAVRASPGVVAVVPIPAGLAIVADTFWHARSALRAAAPVWKAASGVPITSELVRADYTAALAGREWFDRGATGSGAAALDGAATIEASYFSPFQAHATMEPMNCTVDVTPNRCEIWVPTQGVEMTHLVAKQLTGLPDDSIRIHRTLLGGGFGRRLHGDFVKQAILIAQAVKRPVKLLWTREEDMTHDLYRPAVLHQITAATDARGYPSAIRHRVVSPSMLRYVFPRGMFPKLADATEPVDPPQAYDEMTTEGVMHTPYSVEHTAVQEHRLTPRIPVSVWRTTGHGVHNFGLESFVDEIAHRARVDPLDYRLALVEGDARAAAVLRALREKCGWARPLPPGLARGMALAKAFNGYIAQCVELAVRGDDVRVQRVVSVVDCGKVLDPRIAESNIQGGVVWGLSALRTEITLAAGQVEENNFHRFDPLHLWETPAIEVHFAPSGADPGGTGELGPVPTPAAVCNALFAATGRRIRELPLARAGFNFIASRST